MQQKNANTGEVRKLLENTHRSFELKNKWIPSLFALSVGLIWMIALILLEAWLYLTPLAKFFGFGIIISFTAITYYQLNKKRESSSFVQFYRKLASVSELNELAYAFDLENNISGNPKLVKAAIIQNLGKVKPEKLENALQQFKTKNHINDRFKKGASLFFVALFGMLITGFNLPDAGFRTASLWKSFNPPNPYQYSIQPGDTVLEQGTSFSPSISFIGELPSNLKLKLKTDIENSYRDFRLIARGENIYQAEAVELSRNIRYFVEMDGYKSETYTVKVQLRPRLEEFAAQIIPPKYTKLDTTSINYPFSQIRAYQGSEVNFTGKLNKKLTELELVKDSVSIINLNQLVKGEKQIQTSLNVIKPDTLWFVMKDSSGLKNSNPFRFVIQPEIDQHPFVEINEPKGITEEVNIETLPISYRASDDFALSSISLIYEIKKAYIDNSVRDKIKLKIPQNGRTASYTWDINQLDLKPQDEISFWIEATDNDGFNGPKTSRSGTRIIRIPSLVDYFEELGEKEEDVEKTLGDVAESFEQLENEYDEFKRELKENPQRTWEQKGEVENVKRKQEEVQNKIDELNKKFEEIKKELNQNNLLSEETLKAYEELEKLQKEIDDPAFREALEKLQESLESFSPEQLQKALEEVEFNEQAYKERIERTIELFKKLKLTSDLEKIAKTAENLAEQEQNAGNQPEADKKLQQKENILEQSEGLKKQLQKLMDYISPGTKEPVEKFSEEAEKELRDAKQKIEQELEQLKKGGNSSESDRKQNKQEQNIQNHFNKIAQKARETQKNISTQQNQINVAGLTYTLYSLINISDVQEELTEDAQRTENRSQAYIEYAREQKNIEKIFASIADSLFKLSKDIPNLPNRLNEKRLQVEQNINRALEQMTERDQSQASVATRQALGSINDLAFMIAELLEQIQNSQNNGNGQGNASMQQMMQQLQDAAGQQQQLNQQLQELINDVQGNRLTRDQQQRLEQLSKQQNRIRKQIEELRKNGALEEGDRLGSELQRLIEEVEESINDMRGGAVDQLLKERQQNILSRMLEAEKALQERDKEEKREGKTADPQSPPVPPDVTLEELEKEIRNRLQDPDFTKYSLEYQRLIEKYFQLLKQIRGNGSEIQ